MNPDRNSGGMTMNALMLVELFASIGIPTLLFAILGFLFASLQHDSVIFGFVIFGCAVVSLLLVFAINYFTQRRIKDKMLGLVDVCRDYAGGDHTIRANVSGDDEFAMLTMSLNTLLDSPGGTTATPLSSNGSDAATLQAQIEKLLQEVSAVGDGDLRVQAQVTPDTLGVLADSFNYMIEELAKVVGRVQATAVQVTNATRRILDRSAELAQASETQVAQISQTSEAVEALAVFIQTVARNAAMSAEAARDALRNATSGQESVRQTINGMMTIRENVQETSKKIKRLGERSNEISEIINIIADLADQTNLLALNAAIQSAMAGEHGRGFAVVADEIRLLAERSTESTKRISNLVKSIQGDTYEAVVAMEDSTQEVVKGSQVADEAGRALNSIYEAVEKQVKMIESIARSANEQTPVSEAVAVTMAQISEVIRQTDAGTQEAAVSVSYLAELSEQLRASVSTFRLPERGNTTSNTFSSMTSVTEMNDGGQMFPPALTAGVSGMQSTMGINGAESDWNSSFAGSFPPLPDPNNSGSLVALSSRSQQYGFGNQQDYGMEFGGQQNFGGQASFPSQFGQQGNSSGFGNAQAYGQQNEFGSMNGSSGGQQGFGMQGLGQQNFGQYGSSQQGFGDGMFGFDNPPSYNGSNGENGSGDHVRYPSGDSSRYQLMPGDNGQNQSFVPPSGFGQIPGQLPSNPNLFTTPPPSQGAIPSRPRRMNGSQAQPGQSNPNLSPFDQGQPPYSGNGQ